MKGLQQASSTTSTGSTGSNDTLGSLNDCRKEQMLGPEDPASTCYLLGNLIPRSLPPYH
jgi:hypothetical protein